MISKLILSDSFNWDTPSIKEVHVASTGVDREWIKKEAGEGGRMFEEDFKDVKPIPGKTILHVLAVGDHENYGINRNTDSFTAEDNEACHHRFKTQGHLFLDHKHKHPSLAVGEVLKTAHNKPMGRIELLLAADNKKCAKYLTKYADGADIPVSMGCTVDKETCSYCGHVAPTAKHRCEHIKTACGTTLEDGRQVYMQNPDPQYFDISMVWRPADRIGYSFRKIANDDVAEPSDLLALEAGLTSWHPTKLAAIRRVAAIEKRLDGISRELPGKLLAPTMKTLKRATDRDLPGLLGALHREGLLLHPEDFFAIILPEVKTAGLVAALESRPGLAQLLDDDHSYEFLDGQPGRLELPPEVKEACSVEPRRVRARVLKSPIKVAAHGIITPEQEGLAAMYQHYKAAMAAQNLDHQDRLLGLAFVP